MFLVEDFFLQLHEILREVSSIVLLLCSTKFSSSSRREITFIILNAVFALLLDSDNAILHP